MPNSTIERTRAALPAHLRGTFDDVALALYGGQRPRTSVRLDICTACVESFDWLVNVIAASPLCIADILQIPHDGSCKRDHRRDCAVCIRSYAYKSLFNKKEEKLE